MATNGIESLLIETHNWGKSVAFWQSLGFEIEFETDHHSGQLRHPSGGPTVFVAERPPEHELRIMPGLSVPDHASFEPPKAGVVDQPFEAQHWGGMEMLLRDPDGRHVGIQAPPPAGGEAPAATAHAPSGAH